MKKAIWIFSLLISIFLIQEGIAAESFHNEMAKASLFRDSMHKKAYDRQIENYEFISKSSILGGLAFNFYRFNSRDTKLFYSFLDQLNCNVNLFAISPYIGYSFKKNQVFGLRFNVSRIDFALNDLSLKFNDIDFKIDHIFYKQNQYGLIFFHRSYVGLNKEHRFGLFNDLSLSFNVGDAFFKQGIDASVEQYNARSLSSNLSLSPGVAVFIAQNVCMELSFNVAGLNFKKETQQRMNDNKKGIFIESGANFKINLLNLNIGLTVCL